MDTTKTTTHVSLCAGYGGIDLGLGRAIPNLRTIAFSEIEAFACANLVSKMEAGLLDAAPIWTNLKTFPWAEFRDCVDVLSGGYPCQPFSAAGKRLGRDDPRHLWPWIADGIRSMRPRVCFFENVEGHISLGLREVISELEGLGYQTTWGIFSAREVGAPHQRKRVFILGINNSERLERINAQLNNSQGWKIQNRPASIPDGAAQPLLSDTVRNGSGEGGIPCKGSDGSEFVSNGESRRTSMADTSHSPDPTCQHAEADRLPSEYRSEVCSGELRGTNATAWPSRPGQPQHEWEPPRVVGNAKHDGLPTKPILRGDETTSDSWGTEEPKQTWQSSGADRPSDVPSLQGCTSGSESVGNSETRWRGESGDETCEGQGHRSARPSRSNDELSKTEPSLGRDSDGIADWMDDAELFVTSDNRTDELRLLGNGVVPATATRAFLVLMDQLLNENP